MKEVETTGNIKEAFCEVGLEGCKNKEKGVVTSVFENKREIMVCNHCLNKKIDLGDWYVRGAMTTKQRFR